MDVADIAAAVKSVIDDFATTIGVLKYKAKTTENVYKQHAKTFSSAVNVNGHVAYDPSPDLLSAIGSNAPVQGVITFARLALTAAFPLLTVDTAITDKDRLSFDGCTWKVVGVHYTGRLQDLTEVVLVTFDKIEE